MLEGTGGWILAIAVVVILAFLLMLIVDWPQGEELDYVYRWKTAPGGGQVLVCE